jgi:hypothetical protein
MTVRWQLVAGHDVLLAQSFETNALWLGLIRSQVPLMPTEFCDLCLLLCMMTSIYDESVYKQASSGGLHIHAMLPKWQYRS